MKVRFKSRYAGAAAAVLCAVVALAFAGPAAASTPTPPFTQCPAVGLDTSCAILIVVEPNGSLVSYADPTQGPFDGIEDTLIGVQNESSSAVSSIALNSAVFPGIFEFDGDGLCSGFNEGGGSGFQPPPAGCPFGPTSYEGPETSFTIINGNEGTVNFLNGGLAPGKSTYFSLEGAVSLTCSGSSCTGGAPEEAEETTLSTSLSGGGKTGASITVPAGTGVADQAMLGGVNAASAGGTVTYDVYSDSECSQLAASAGTVTVSNGEVPPSESQVFYLPGTYYWQASYSGDARNKPSVSECGSEIQNVTGLGGNFVISDKAAAMGGSVTFWGAQWWKLNPLRTGLAPAAFKGFESSPAIAACGKAWSARTGNSTPPPAGPLPAYIPVIVTGNVKQSGSTITGNTVHVDLVKVNPGYAPNPGHAGTGTIVSQVC